LFSDQKRKHRAGVDRFNVQRKLKHRSNSERANVMKPSKLPNLLPYFKGTLDNIDMDENKLSLNLKVCQLTKLDHILFHQFNSSSSYRT